MSNKKAIPVFLLIALLLLFGCDSPSEAAQYARPSTDTAVASWTRYPTDTTLYTQINEETKDDDSTYIQGTLSCGTYVTKLSSVDTPTDPSSCTMYIWYRSSGSGAGEKIDFELVEDYEGSPITRGSWINQSNRSSSYANMGGAIDLSAVSDWGNLYFKAIEDTIGSGEYYYITQVYLETPDAGATPTPQVVMIMGDELLLGGGVPVSGCVGTDWTVDADMIAYWLFEDTFTCTSDLFADSETSNGSTDLDCASGTTPERSAVQKMQGDYALYCAGNWERVQATDANLETNFPGKDVGGNYGDFTVGGWVYIDDFTATQTFFSKGGEPVYRLWMDTTDDHALFEVETREAESTTAMSEDTWYFLAGVYDADTGNYIYLGTKGVTQESFEDSNLFADGLPDTDTNPFEIGYGLEDACLYGYADMVFVINQTLTAAELNGIKEYGLDGCGY